jgi:hypothetical protein
LIFSVAHGYLDAHSVLCKQWQDGEQIVWWTLVARYAEENHALVIRAPREGNVREGQFLEVLVHLSPGFSAQPIRSLCHCDDHGQGYGVDDLSTLMQQNIGGPHDYLMFAVV